MYSVISEVCGGAHTKLSVKILCDVSSMDASVASMNTSMDASVDASMNTSISASWIQHYVMTFWNFLPFVCALCQHWCLNEFGHLLCL